MPEESDPPRKVYGFKSREFETINTPSAPADSIDVRTLARQAAGTVPILGHNGPVNRPNDVHAMLRATAAAAEAAGVNAVKIDPHYRSKHERRVRRFWVAVILIDGALGAYAWWMGHEAAIPFVSAIAGIGFITGRLIWKTFFSTPTSARDGRAVPTSARPRRPKRSATPLCPTRES